MGIFANVRSILSNQKLEVEPNQKLIQTAEQSEYEKISSFDFREDDIFIVSYPKSGNTWTRFIIANLLTKGTEEVINFRNIENYVPDLHKSFDLIKGFASPRYIKSHSQHYQFFPKFIYIVRDGRDALVSFYHYYLDWKAFEGTFSDFLRSELPGKNYGDWCSHVRNALNVFYTHPDKVLLLKYERMLADPALAVRQIAAFCNIEASDEDIAQTVAKCSFQMLRENEVKFGSEIQTLDMTFFRKGTSNQWRKYFTEEDHDFFLWHHSDMLIKNGYCINYD